MMKRFAMLALALVLACVCAAGMAETLKVGMECNYAPYNWTQSEPGEEAVALAAAAMPTATTCALPSASPRSWAWSWRSSRPSGTAWCPA